MKPTKDYSFQKSIKFIQLYVREREREREKERERERELLDIAKFLIHLSA